ncbi:MAG: 4Fe-4S dicluster domain-containing protein [Gemmatimonadales bacterium]|nr:MAG: 4Fe-4S dicluster domain-containing protein [Gemmatimonadales bacterium]
MSDGMKRRDFLKVLGVTGAGAGLVGCSTDNVEKLMPYVTAPEDITPGVATWYASACGECPAGCGVWVKTQEGRAIKVEGNPNHPVSGGALCARGHSGLQALYNPDRLESPMRRNGDGHEAISWEEAEEMLASGLRDAGSGTAFLTGRTGPTLSVLMDELVGELGGRRVEYEALSEAPLREASRIAFGRDEIPAFDLESADLILSFGADFLETWLSPVEHNRGFARSTGVQADGSKARFVFLGARLSLTGMNADDWYPVRPGSEGVVALALAGALVDRGGDAGPYASLVQEYDLSAAAEAADVPVSSLETLVDLLDEAESPLILGPGVAGQHRNATAANLAALVLNAVSGAVGTTLHFDRAMTGAASSSYGDLATLISDMEGGAVSALVVRGTNPAFSLPSGSGFREAMENVGFSVALATQMDETAVLADLVLPEGHYLESWGDSNPRPGVWAVQQPVMQPVPHFDSRGTGDILLSLARNLGVETDAETFHDYLRNRWSDRHSEAGQPGGGFEAFWRQVLREGLAQFPADAVGEVELQSPDRALSFDLPEMDGEDDGLNLIVYPSSRLGDGRGANRPWLQELPDPVSKIAWHSWVEVHPDTAAEMGIRKGDIVRLETPHGEVQAPVWTYGGVRRDTVAIAMGSGHENYGRYADGKGVNAMRLLPAVEEAVSGALVHLVTRVQIEPTGRHRRLATIEGSDQTRDRAIVPAVQVDDLRAGDLGDHEPRPRTELRGGGGFIPVPSDAEPESFPHEGSRYGDYDPAENRRWAMAIDLDKCTGCSACITACQSENNVANVGEDQLLMGRDLHWIRMERYVETLDAEEPGPVDIRFLPMICQHCGNAPCEPVCPVYAAYHTPDGLNGQIYNRCVGTRYCANNCPYKVRVFNWFGFSDVPEPLNWQYNPDVTVRAEGVMEKCSFCVQRIRTVENRASTEGRDVRDGEVVPACQQSCPAEAIVFGDARDPESRLSQVSRDGRTYRVMDHLINTQPAVNYLRKVTFHPVTDIHV